MTPEQMQELDAEIDRLVFDGGKFVGLMKRGYWYAPNAQGYTADPLKAGRFTMEEAKKHECPHDEPVTIHQFPASKFTQGERFQELLEKCGKQAINMEIWTAGDGVWYVTTPDRFIKSWDQSLPLALCLFAKEVFK